MTQAQGNHPPKLTFLPNTPVQVYFPYGDGKEIPSSRGFQPSYKYSTEVNDVKHTLFASAGLHRELQIRDIGPQCYVTITKGVELDENNKEVTRWQVLNVDGSERPAVDFSEPTQTPQVAPANGAAPPPQQAAPAAAQPAVIAAPGSREDAVAVWKSVASAAKRCVAQAEKIYADLGYKIDREALHTDEIQALASTMFIQLSRQIDLTLLGPQPDPPPASPQPPAAPPPPQQAPANPADDDLPF